MRPMLVALGLVAATASAAHPQAPSSPPPPTFAATVNVVRLDVSARHDGWPLLGLAPGDFEVLDDGAPQRVEVESVGGPVHAILLLDTSGSVAGDRLLHLRAAAHALLDDLSGEDHVTVLTFSHAVRLASPPSRDKAAAHRALDDAEAGGGTALHDAVFAALQFADPAKGRAVVLVFTDGDDRLSWLDSARLRDAARSAEATVYAVALEPSAIRLHAPGVQYLPEARGRQRGPDRAEARSSSPSGRRSPPRELPPLLRDMASDTGGRVWRADDAAQLRTAFLEALAEAKSRYLLRFEPSTSRPGWHPIEVRLKGRRGEVRTRRGYLAP